MTNDRLKLKIKEIARAHSMEAAQKIFEPIAKKQNLKDYTLDLKSDSGELLDFINVNSNFKFAYIEPERSKSTDGIFASNEDLSKKILNDLSKLEITCNTDDQVVFNAETMDFVITMRTSDFLTNPSVMIDFILEHSYEEAHAGIFILPKSRNWLISFNKLRKSYSVHKSV